MNTSNSVIQTLKDQNFEQLASFVHKDKGVTFSPYSHIDSDAVTMTSTLLKEVKPTDMFLWGIYDGSGFPINLSIKDYFDEIVFAHDFTKVTQIAIDEYLNGSALYDNNYTEVFPDTHFVVYHYPGADYPVVGLDWISLRLIFEEVDNQWFLVGIVRDCWTI